MVNENFKAVSFNNNILEIHNIDREYAKNFPFIIRRESTTKEKS